MHKFGCYKPGGRSMSPSTARELKAKNPDAVCEVKSKGDSDKILYYRRPGVADKIELGEKKEKAEKQEKTLLGKAKTGPALDRVRARISKLADRLRANEDKYKEAMRLLHPEKIEDKPRQGGQELETDKKPKGKPRQSKKSRGSQFIENYQRKEAPSFYKNIPAGMPKKLQKLAEIAIDTVAKIAGVSGKKSALNGSSKVEVPLIRILEKVSVSERDKRRMGILQNHEVYHVYDWGGVFIKNGEIKVSPRVESASWPTGRFVGPIKRWITMPEDWRARSNDAKNFYLAQENNSSILDEIGIKEEDIKSLSYPAKELGGPDITKKAHPFSRLTHAEIAADGVYDASGQKNIELTQAADELLGLAKKWLPIFGLEAKTYTEVL